MKTKFDRILWTVIAAALVVIAVNPWIGPTKLSAQSGIMKVDIVRVEGIGIKFGHPLPVKILP